MFTIHNDNSTHNYTTNVNVKLKYLCVHVCDVTVYTRDEYNISFELGGSETQRGKITNMNETKRMRRIRGRREEGNVGNMSGDVVVCVY